DVGLSFVSKEWKAGPIRAANPWATFVISGAGNFDSGLVGRRVTDVGGTVIMTAASGSPAAAAPAPATLTLCAIREGCKRDWLLASMERDLPFDFRVFGVTDGGSPIQPRYYSVT